MISYNNQRIVLILLSVALGGMQWMTPAVTAFSIVGGGHSKASSNTVSRIVIQHQQQQRQPIGSLYAQDVGDSSTEGTTEETAAADESDTEADEEEPPAEVEEEEEGEEEPAEDPELVALKEEIAKREGLLKEKRRQVGLTADQADEYTKTGYARKVAEMENMRRARSMLQSSDKSSATASILTEFLPIFDKLTSLREQYGEDDFGKQYNALVGDMKGTFNRLGVTEYTVGVGDAVDTQRMVVLDSEHSADHPAGTVLRPVSLGLELKGNVMRMAECIASLGPEASEEKDEEEDEKEEEEEEDSEEGEETEEDTLADETTEGDEAK